MGNELRKTAVSALSRVRPELALIVAPSFADISHFADASGLLNSARVIPLELTDGLPPENLPSNGVVVVQVDPTVPSSMNRIDELRARSPGLSVVVAFEQTDIRLVRTLIRGGVADAISLPLEEDELLQAVLAAAQTNDQDVRQAPVVAVIRPLGGGGATTMVTHLAASFAASGCNTCLIDLDLQLGRASEVLGLSPRRTIADLFEAGETIDEMLLEAVLQRHSSGLNVIAAPTEIFPIEAVGRDQLQRVINLVRHEHELVFIDFPASLTNWSLSLLANADEIIMLVEQGLSSLRQGKRLLDLFSAVGIESSAVSVVVNRARNKLFGSINTSDVEGALGRDILGVLRPDEGSLKVAQDQGLLVHEVRGKSGYAGDIHNLVEKIRQRLGRAAS